VKLKLHPRTETRGAAGICGYRLDCPSCGRRRAPTDYVGDMSAEMLVGGEVVVRCGICGTAYRARKQPGASPPERWEWSRLG